MCKRLVIPDQEEAEQEISVLHPWWTFSARFNVGVSQSVPVIRLHQGESEGVMMRWGFVPSTTEGNVSRLGTAVVRSDGVSTSEDYRTAWLYGQRCILPVAGFYLWQLTAAGFRQPFYVRLVNRTVFGVAALWERTVTDDDDVIESCALITVPANPLIAEIDGTTRQMPAILRREDYGTWLEASVGQAKPLLQPYPHDRMLTHPVGPHVNYLEYDEPRLIEAIR
jgi:putative SOS response-associated peptidase YedK